MEAIITFLFLVIIYLLPSIIGRHKNSFAGIILLNIFLGWTFIGWLAALIWAASAKNAKKNIN